MNWNLSRPTPSALPNSHFWTWDHSTNWMLDDPGTLTFGCRNHYLKSPETYLEDYRRLTDLAAGLGIKGIIIWGFLRDSHGGVEYAKRVAGYAASKGVAIMPGFGTTCYGGGYYEGDHPYNLRAFLDKTPEARAQMKNDLDGRNSPGGACASSPAYLDWLREGMQWMFKEFEIGGANLENGDFLVCHCPRCQERKEPWPPGDPDFFRFQAMSYELALRAVEDLLEDKLITWATYTGFLPGKGTPVHLGPWMQCERPVLVDTIPNAAVAQWTITGMLLQKPLPLATYLDDGAPNGAFDNPSWPNSLRPLTRRSCGFVHQGSQWATIKRFDLAVSSIKEACLRAYRTGLEGVVIHGEVTSRQIPNALNYLAFSHFTHWPEDNLRDFGRKTLGQVFEDEDEGEALAEAMARWESGLLTKKDEEDIHNRAAAYRDLVYTGKRVWQWRFWQWLSYMAIGRIERHTMSFY